MNIPLFEKEIASYISQKYSTLLSYLNKKEYAFNIFESDLSRYTKRFCWKFWLYCTIDTVAYSIRNQTRVQWKHNGLEVFLQKRATKLTAGAMTMNHYINMQRPLFSMCSQIEHFQDNKAICKNSHNSGWSLSSSVQCFNRILYLTTTLLHMYTCT